MALLTPVAPRDPAQAHRAATALELFTDLCYVVGIAQAVLALEHEIAEGHGGHGLVYFAIAFFGVWWAWLNFAWFSSAYDPDDVTHRVLTLLQILGSLVLAAGIPRFFDEDFTLGIVGYVIMRVGLVLMWLRVAAGHPERRTTALRYVVGLVAVQGVWVVALLVTGGELALWQFLVIAALELAVPAFAETAGATPWHPHHIAERYGLFFIIVLGETILAATVAIQEGLDDTDSPPATLWLVVIGGVLIVFAAWWLYFARENAEVLVGNDVGFVWGFGHLLVFGTAAAIGAGLAARVAYYDDHAEVSEIASAAFVTAPVAALLAALWLVCIRLHDASWRTIGPFAAAIMGCLAVTFVPWSELWVGLIVTGLLVVELVLTSEDRAGVVGAAD